MMWDCTCIGSLVAEDQLHHRQYRCHEGGRSNTIGTLGRGLMKALTTCWSVCVLETAKEWTCKPVAERCYDNNAASSYVVGETWRNRTKAG
ncbi:hypothetical protein INR49_007889 [Caranx melampygus]|nr:hypothetical protein INR49_007889 [Caranx melampygus]